MVDERYLNDQERFEHAHWMRRAIVEGRKARGLSFPNPPVGCVLVHKNKVLSEGHTQRIGCNHAEVECLSKLEHIPLASVLYVTLEPCAHHGRVGPCTDYIIQRGLRRVVFGIFDPNKIVNGRGFQRLSSAGIDVVVGVGAETIKSDLRDYIDRCLSQ